MSSEEPGLWYIINGRTENTQAYCTGRKVEENARKRRKQRPWQWGKRGREEEREKNANVQGKQGGGEKQEEN